MIIMVPMIESAFKHNAQKLGRGPLTVKVVARATSLWNPTHFDNSLVLRAC